MYNIYYSNQKLTLKISLAKNKRKKKASKDERKGNFSSCSKEKGRSMERGKA